MEQELKQGDEIMCIKTAKMLTGPNVGKIAFKKNNIYIILNNAIQVIDELDTHHGVKDPKWFNKHFVIKNQPNKVTFTEEFELSDKAVFVLRVMQTFSNQTVNSSSGFDWLRRERNYTWEEEKQDSTKKAWTYNEEKSLDKAFQELSAAKLFDRPKTGEGCYFEYTLNNRGKEALRQLIHKDVKQFYHLIPENCRTGVNKIKLV